MSHHSKMRVFEVAILGGLLAGFGTMDLGYGLAAFVIVFLGFGGWKFLTERHSEIGRSIKQ